MELLWGRGQWKGVVAACQEQGLGKLRNAGCLTGEGRRMVGVTTVAVLTGPYEPLGRHLSQV